MGVQPSLADIQMLLTEAVFPFYQIKRDMPLPHGGNENDAEHSWALAFMALALAPQVDPSLKAGLLCQFAVIHDLVEIYAGDTSVWSNKTTLGSKKERETKAIAQIKQRFHTFPYIADIIEEYERKNSPEARFIYALDKFLNLLVVYEDKGKKYRSRGITRADFDQMIASHRPKAHTHESVKHYYDELLKLHYQDPEFFYNAHVTGDKHV